MITTSFTKILKTVQRLFGKGKHVAMTIE